jgi:hypothetical protein
MYSRRPDCVRFDDSDGFVVVGFATKLIAFPIESVKDDDFFGSEGV